MNTSYILLAFVAANLLVTISLADNGFLHMLDKKLVNNYEKINDYLDKKASSDRGGSRLDKIKRWNHSKLSMFSDESCKEALQLLMSLPDKIENFTTCNSEWNLRLLSGCDAAASDMAHLTGKDYPLKEFDRILELAGYKHARRCMLDKDRPGMSFAYKQATYSEINWLLNGKLLTDDPEANMGAAEEILEGLANKDGSHGEALRQLLSLKTISDKSSCTDWGTEIVLKNDLATRGKAHVSFEFPRRIDHLVHHYSLEHSKVCNAIYQRNCLARLHQLDVESYRRVLALASVQHSTKPKFSDQQVYDHLVAEANGARVDGDFIVPSIAGMKDFSMSGGEVVRLHTDQLVKLLKAATKPDARSRFLEKVVDEELGVLALDRKKVEELYDDYVHRPCEKFNSLVGPDMDIFNYNWLPMRETFELPLSFRLLQSAANACKIVSQNKKLIFDWFMNELSQPQNTAT